MHEKYALQRPISRLPTVHPAIFADHSLCTFNYISSGTGAGWAANYSTVCAHSCLYGIYLKTRSPSAQANDVVSIAKNLPLHPTKTITLQLLFAHYINNTGAVFTASLSFHDGTSRWTAALRFSQNTGEVARLGSDSNYHALPNVPYCTINATWNHIALAADFNANRLQFLTVNNAVYDGRQHDMEQAASALPAHLALALTLQTTGAAYRRLCLDHLLISPDNP